MKTHSNTLFFSFMHLLFRRFRSAALERSGVSMNWIFRLMDQSNKFLSEPDIVAKRIRKGPRFLSTFAPTLNNNNFSQVAIKPFVWLTIAWLVLVDPVDANAYSSTPPTASDPAVVRLRLISASTHKNQLIDSIVLNAKSNYLHFFGQQVEIDIASPVGGHFLMNLLGDEETRKLTRERVDGTDIRIIPKLAAAIGNTLRQAPSQLGSVQAYANASAAHLKQPTNFNGSRRSVARQLARIHVLKHRELVSDGVVNPFNSNALLAEYNTWQSIGSRNNEFEIVLVDNLIASTELSEPDIHSALRGGISNGITVPSPNSRTGSMSILSLAPFFAQSKALSNLRDAPHYTEEEAIEFASLMLTHELGHQLLKLGHPWGNAACVMRPPLLLRFREWAKQLDRAKCKLGSEAAMSPGAIKFAP